MPPAARRVLAIGSPRDPVAWSPPPCLVPGRSAPPPPGSPLACPGAILRELLNAKSLSLRWRQWDFIPREGDSTSASLSRGLRTKPRCERPPAPSRPALRPSRGFTWRPASPTWKPTLKSTVSSTHPCDLQSDLGLAERSVPTPASLFSYSLNLTTNC
jgi:hypothetical protein